MFFGFIFQSKSFFLVSNFTEIIWRWISHTNIEFGGMFALITHDSHQAQSGSLTCLRTPSFKKEPIIMDRSWSLGE